MKNILIYGAYGYSAKLALREAINKGRRPIIGGRNKEKLIALAREFDLEYRHFTVTQIDNNLLDIDVLLNCAGPFSQTAKSLINACIEQRTHYIDFAGEISVFQYGNEVGANAAANGVTICSGAGFDIAPTDCLSVILSKQLPDSQNLELAFSFGTRPSVGTALTIIEGLNQGGLIRHEGKLKSVPQAFHIKPIAFSDRKRWCATIPWADIFTSGISTSIPNCEVYTALPLPIGIFLRLTSPLGKLLGSTFAQRALKKMAERYMADGPNQEDRSVQSTAFYGKVSNEKGEAVEAVLTCPNVYDITAIVAIKAAEHCLENSSNAGFYTPAMLMGTDWLLAIEGVSFSFT